MRRPGQFTTAEELSGAALQFVRKISGFHKPSKTNQEAFERAVREISAASRRLLESLGASLANAAGRDEVPGAPCATMSRAGTLEAEISSKADH